MARQQGSRTALQLAFESVYGTAPVSGFVTMPFASETLGLEQPLLDSELLGYGRDPLKPVRDAITCDGDIVVPVDVIGIGYWLKGLLGQPTTVGVIAATGSMLFTALPAVNSTVTINGTVFTFVASGAAGNQVNIGGSITATANNLQTVLNASVVAGVLLASYTSPSTSLIVTYKTLGTAGNAFTLAASTSPASSGTVSGATLTGGTNSHTFASGGGTLPSLSLQKDMQDLPQFFMFSGIRVDKLNVKATRSGLLQTTLSLIAQGMTPNAVTQAGSPAGIALDRFGNFNGSIKRDGVALANIISAEMTYTNNLDRVETIRSDGKIDGLDPTIAALMGKLTARLSDTVLLDLATNGTPCAIDLAWTLDAARSLTLTAHEIYLPRPKVPIPGPSGIQVEFDFQGALNATATRMFTAVLRNAVAAY